MEWQKKRSQILTSLVKNLTNLVKNLYLLKVLILVKRWVISFFSFFVLINVFVGLWFELLFSWAMWPIACGSFLSSVWEENCNKLQIDV